MSRPAYRWRHRQERARALRPLVDGMACEICGQPMYRGMRLDYDHIAPLALGGAPDGLCRLVHSRCNRVRGNRTKRMLRRARQPRSAEYNRW